MSAARQDLVVVVADKSMEMVVKTLLARAEEMRIRSLAPVPRIIVPGTDGEIRVRGIYHLALHTRNFRHAMMLFDFEGSGENEATSLELEHRLDARLRDMWGEDRAKCIVLDPEIEAWTWGAESLMGEVLRKPDSSVRGGLREKGFEFDENGKAKRPKEALEAAIRPRALSASIHGKIASRIGLDRCTDPAFLRFREALRRWFPPDA